MILDSSLYPVLRCSPVFEGVKNDYFVYLWEFEAKIPWRLLACQKMWFSHFWSLQIWSTDLCQSAIKQKAKNKLNRIIAPKKKQLYGPFFLWMGFNCFKATATSRRQFTFYHSVPGNSWYSTSWHQLRNVKIRVPYL